MFTDGMVDMSINNYLTGYKRERMKNENKRTKPKRKSMLIQYEIVKHVEIVIKREKQA